MIATHQAREAEKFNAHDRHRSNAWNDGGSDPPRPRCDLFRSRPNGSPTPREPQLRLLDRENMMCCLGFFLEACGVEREDLFNKVGDAADTRVVPTQHPTTEGEKRG